NGYTEGPARSLVSRGESGRVTSQSQLRFPKKMEKFWWSGEIQADVAEPYSQAMRIINEELNRLMVDISLGGKVEQWAFIAIILNEQSSIYDEVVKKSERGKTLEFRLKIPHAQFLSASPSQRMSLVFGALSGSVELMEKLGVPVDTRQSLH